MEGGIFLTIKDLMLLTGSKNYYATAKSHKSIREAIAKGKRKITIREYCSYEKIAFSEIWQLLRT